MMLMMMMMIMMMIVIKLNKCYFSCYFSHSAGGGSWDSSGDEDNNMFGSNSKVRKAQKVVISLKKCLSSTYIYHATMYVNLYNFLLFLCNPPHLQVCRFYLARFLPWGRLWDTRVCKYAKFGVFYTKIVQMTPQR